MLIIIPIKLKNPKTRLAGILNKEQRRKLVLTMLSDILSALEGRDVIIVLDFPKENLKGKFRKIVEEQEGLNHAVGKATKYALEKGYNSTLFLPGDVPLVKKGDIAMIEKLGENYNLVLSPSNDKGITSLFRRPPNVIKECFSSKSFEDFVKEAENRKISYHIYYSTSLSIDIDTPQDLKEFMLIGKGTRTYEFLESIGPEVKVCARR